MKYQYHSASDLAADDFFIQWVKAPTPESNRFWENWMERNPWERELVEDARQIVLLLSEDEDELHEWELEAMWQHLHRNMKPGSQEAKGGAKVIPLWGWSRMGAAAAVITLLLLASAFLLYRMSRVETMEYTTAYGEKRTIKLPDSSVVVLNANSKISFPQGWSESEPRLVQLEGEAFFEVTHQANNQQFIVQTADGIEVEVLGTTFDVSSRRARNRVVLATGKIRLNYRQGAQGKQLVMKPGELVEVAENEGEILRKNVRTELYTSWKEDKVIFDDTSLREVAYMLEEQYGYEVTLMGVGLGDLKLTAQLDDRGGENILTAVSETLGLTVAKHKQQIIISLTNK